MCIHRHEMPQLHKRDYGELKAWLLLHSVTMTHTHLPLNVVQSVQCISETRVNGLRDVLRRLEFPKPLLVSLDLKVVDGNHHLAVWRECGLKFGPAYVFNRAFHPLIDLLKTFPKVEYKDK